MSSHDGGSGDTPLAGSSGDGGSAEWRRIYDRVEAQVELLAAGLARLEALNGLLHEYGEARDSINQARLHEAVLSRSRWEAACKDLLPQDSPKLTELLECDLEDSRLCKARFEIENSELKLQLKEVGTCVELSENNDQIARDLRADLRKLNQGYETLCANKDKEVSTLLAGKDSLVNELRAMEKENTALLKIKELEGAQATKATHQLQINVEELQVAARNKDDEIRILQAEALAAKNKLLLSQDKLDEMQSLAMEKDIQKLKDGQLKSLKRKRASSPNATSPDEFFQKSKERKATGDPSSKMVIGNKSCHVNTSSGVKISEPAAMEPLPGEEAQEAGGNSRWSQVIVAATPSSLRTASDPAYDLAKLNVIQHEFWKNCDNINLARLREAVLSRNRWEAACKELLPQDSPKLTELMEYDLEDARLCEARFQIQNEELKIQLEEIQVAAQNRDNEIARSHAEAVNAKKKVLILDGKLLEMDSLVKEKNDEIQKLKNGKTEILKCKRASSVSNNDGQNDSLHLARIEKIKANENVLILVEKHKKEKEAALNKLLDKKQKLELDIAGKLEMVKHIEGEVKRSEELTKELDEKVEEMECCDGMIQSLIIQERRTKYELQDGRKELIKGLAGLLKPHGNIGIKRIGELDEKVFVRACEEMYGVEAETKAFELCSLWQEYLRDASWHPFKAVATGEMHKQIINEDDEKLVGLKEQLEEDVYKDVTTALLEINQYNASGSYMVSELWNNKENKRASMREVVEYIRKQWKVQKRKR